MSKISKKTRKKLSKVLDLPAIEFTKLVDKRAMKFSAKFVKALLKKGSPEVRATITPRSQNDDFPGFDNISLEAQIHIVSQMSLYQVIFLSAQIGYKIKLK